MRTSNRTAYTLLITPLRSLSPKLLRLMMSCYLTVALVVPAHAYNPDKSHRWITEKAIEYLQLTDPMAYTLANQYKHQLLFGVWYADKNSGTCIVDAGIQAPSLTANPLSTQWPCDSANHYEPKFSFTFLGLGANASVSASTYARDLFSVASSCWHLRDVPVNDLPASCLIPKWRGVGYIGPFGDFGVFRNNGPPFGASPMVLLGWVLHLVQDVTVVHHTYSTPDGGHTEFENHVDGFIEAGSTAAALPVNRAETSLNVINPELFVQEVASETRGLAVSRGWLWDLAQPGQPPRRVCCRVYDKLDDVAEVSVNRAIVYSAKLLSFYLRQPAIELSSAIWASVF